MATFIDIVRWLIGGLAALGWLLFVFDAIGRVITGQAGEIAKTTSFVISLAFAIVAVVVLPVGTLGQRAPFGFLAVAPEVVWVADLVLMVVRNRRSKPG